MKTIARQLLNGIKAFGVIAVYLGVLGISATSMQVSAKLTLQPIIENLPPSWAIAVAPNERIFITQRQGILYSTDINGKDPIRYDLALEDLYYHGQGGLLAIAFAPNFSTEPWLYLSYSYGTADANGLKVIRVMLDEDNVLKQENIFKQQDLRDTAAHYGARLAFLSDSSLLISTGDGFDYREKAQLDSSQLGKVLRLAPNSQEGEKPFSNVSLFSKGHRNPQGLIVLPNDIVVSHEHGPDGGDEINVIEQGNNYGWPVITNGKDYIGGLISPFTEYPNMQQPGFDWTPSIAPAGMVYYAHDAIPALANSLLISSLKYQQLHSVSLDLSGTSIRFDKEQIHFPKSGIRMRDVSQTQSGRVFILGDGDNASVFEVVTQ